MVLSQLLVIVHLLHGVHQSLQDENVVSDIINQSVLCGAALTYLPLRYGLCHAVVCIKSTVIVAYMCDLSGTTAEGQREIR